MASDTEIFKTVHGVLVNINGLGVLITGPSGIGKSECALCLILRGSRLVSDDNVIVRNDSPATLKGSAPRSIRHLMHFRDLGIVNIKETLGESAVLEHSPVDIVIRLGDKNRKACMVSVPPEEIEYALLGVRLPYFAIPAGPAARTASAVGVTARNALSPHYRARCMRSVQNTITPGK